MHGIYTLEIRLDRDTRVRVGGLGEIEFAKGTYVYVGSAQRNLEKRVQRHLRKEKKLFWHIDYLLSSRHAKITNVMHGQAGKAEECALAQELEKQATPVLAFGCSDCHCNSHLFLLPTGSSVGKSGLFTPERGWSAFKA